MQVEIWSDVVCPWCYLGKQRFERALAQFEFAGQVEVIYRSFELDPTAPLDQTTPTVELLSTKYGLSADAANAAQVQMEERAAADGLTFHLGELRSGNTRDAHRLLHLAQARGRQPELVERLHRAYFTEQRSVFEPTALVELAVEAGLDRADAQRVLDGDDYADAVDEDEALARSFGATGVPFFVFDRTYAISGAQPTETFTAALQRSWADSLVG